MRPEISNKLLLQVIQAWNPAEAESWSVSDFGDLKWNDCYLRSSGGEVSWYVESDRWKEPCKLVGFLLKDRPDLNLCFGRSPKEVKKKSLESFDAFWDSDPWGQYTPATSVVQRIKSHEYLREWKESQENTINPHDVTLSIDGQAIEGIEIRDDVLEVPATYEKICPHCNGSKEVTGWSGKESCQACS